jgi:SulP family sulfate permease
MKKNLVADILSGLTVSFAALSLGAAFGLMSGRGALSGMIGAAIIPIITSLFGGTRIQASGPTAPMTSITAVIVALAYEKFASDKLMAEQLISLTILLSSACIILMGVFRLGKFIQLVPQVVVLGFMNGIGVLIWVDQIRKLVGLGKQPIEGGIAWNVGIATATLLTIFCIPIILKKCKVPVEWRKFFPGMLISILLYAFLTHQFGIAVEHVTLGDEVTTIKGYLSLLGDYFPSDSSLFTRETFWLILPFSLQLTLLAYLDSLLTSLVIDKMTKEKTKPNRELIAQGAANGVAALFHGIPGAQATIRSVLLINEGAKTRLAGVLVGVFALIGFVVLGKYITLIAAAIFVGVLLKAGLDVLDRDFPKAFFQYKWYRNRNRIFQAFIIVYTTLITVMIDLNVAVFTGTLFFYLARYLFKMQDVEEDFSVVESNELIG